MMDQAQGLRELVNKVKQKNNQEKPPETKVDKLIVTRPDGIMSGPKARVIAVTSGKGGVGKTNLAVNLAIAMNQAGFKVLILDADYGLANIEVILGGIPKHNLIDVLMSNKSLTDIIMRENGSIQYISCGYGIDEMTTLSEVDTTVLIQKMSGLDELFDFVIVDTGAGISENVLNLVMASDEVIVITTPEHGSIKDAYVMIKRIAGRDKKKIIKILVNRAETEKEALQIFGNLQEVAGKYVGMKIDSLGYLFSDEAVKKAMMLKEPVIVSYPRSSASKMLQEISKKMLVFDDGEYTVKTNRGVGSFFNNILK